MVRIVTDSTANVPEEMARSLRLVVVPYYIHRGKEVLRDMVDARPDEFFRWMRTARVVPKTATPGPGEYLEALRRLAGETDEIVTIHMTSKGSGAYQAALVAKEMFAQERPDVAVEVVDTLQVAMSHGWAVIEAARAALNGASMDEVVRIAKDVAAKGTMLQTADTLRYLYLGGRIGRASHLMGTLLNIKPIVGVEDGVIVGIGKARSRKKAYETIVRIMVKKLGDRRRIKAAFMHCDALEEVLKLRSMVWERFERVEEIVTSLPPSLGVHSGPGTVGVSFYPVGGGE